MVPSPPEKIRANPHLIRIGHKADVYRLAEARETLLLVLHGALHPTLIAAGSTQYAFASTPQDYVQLARDLHRSLVSEVPELTLSEAKSRFPVVRFLKAVLFGQAGRHEDYVPNCLYLETDESGRHSFGESRYAFETSHQDLEALAKRLLQEFGQISDDENWE